MINQNPPYKVTRATPASQKRVHLVIPCNFIGGPLAGSIVRVPAGPHGIPPPTYELDQKVYPRGSWIGTYKNLPGTTNFYWK